MVEFRGHLCIRGKISCIVVQNGPAVIVVVLARQGVATFHFMFAMFSAALGAAVRRLCQPRRLARSMLAACHARPLSLRVVLAALGEQALDTGPVYF